MFSEELSILDKNTVMMMIEEQQETIEQQKQELSKKDETIGQSFLEVMVIKLFHQHNMRSAFNNFQL